MNIPLQPPGIASCLNPCGTLRVRGICPKKWQRPLGCLWLGNRQLPSQSLASDDHTPPDWGGRRTGRSSPIVLGRRRRRRCRNMASRASRRDRGRTRPQSLQGRPRMSSGRTFSPLISRGRDPPRRPDSSTMFFSEKLAKHDVAYKRINLLR
ncbi:UNVERIFIED_CONTAM: hypothetical protein Sangu_1440700 [Sesamum angustifolium]|uniref:Uncharacterized protein n=1 Tax=Sesamum angustifolium TaxID=2727405 RepID=A0AAW2N9V3_9LAMI